MKMRAFSFLQKLKKYCLLCDFPPTLLNLKLKCECSALPRCLCIYLIYHHGWKCEVSDRQIEDKYLFANYAKKECFYQKEI